MSVADDAPDDHQDRAELQVPRILRAADVLGTDGDRVHGRLFLPASAESHAGAMRAEEWMNDPTEFYPFLPEGEGRPVILSKAQTVMVTVKASDEHDDTLDGAPAPRRRVSVECGSVRIEGEVTIDLPTEHVRVLDLLNERAAFVTIRDGDHHHLVRKSHITRVSERPGSGPVA